MLLLSPLLTVYSWVLQPVAPFSWFGSPLSTLDVVAAFRLCIALRQIRELSSAAHVAKHGPSAKRDSRSFVKDVANTLIVVYGGEALTCPFLGIPPSFMVSGTVPIFYTVVQAIVEYLPAVPVPSFETELPLAIVDGFTRAFLLCTLIPPPVTQNASAVISTSPWTLVLTSLLTANTGFFITNLFSTFSPGPMSVTTPVELQPYGWTTTDLWCAPVITALYAFLTHAQPFWAELHGLLATFIGGAVSQIDANGVEVLKVVPPMRPEEARAFCAMILATMFTTRAVKNFRPDLLRGSKMVKVGKKLEGEKKTQ